MNYQLSFFSLNSFQIEKVPQTNIQIAKGMGDKKSDHSLAGFSRVTDAQ